MPETTSKVSPLVAIAAVAVTIFCAVGVGVMTGIIPSTSSKTGEQPVKPEAPQATAPAPAPAPAAAPASVPAEKPKAATVAPKKPSTERVRVATAEPARVPEPARLPEPVQTPEPARAPEPARIVQVCTNCGSVISVNVIKQEGEGSGLGAIGGAVVGGVLGHQIGGGRGRDVATVVGAGAGAYAGHQIEKNVKTTQTYNVAVRMDDGSTRSFPYQTEPGFRAGDKVKVVEGKLVGN